VEPRFDGFNYFFPKNALLKRYLLEKLGGWIILLLQGDYFF